MADKCEFRDLKDSLIRDRIVLGVTDHVRERLLRVPDLTLVTVDSKYCSEDQTLG